MKVSAASVAEVSFGEPGFVTVMLTEPTASAGEVEVSSVDETKCVEVPAVVPKATVALLAKY